MVDGGRAGHLEPRRLSAGALPQPDVHNGHDPPRVNSTRLGRKSRILPIALRRFRAIAYAKLVQDVADVRLDGAR